MTKSNGRAAGKVAVVTGGASGIGAGVVRMLVTEGAKVAFTDILRAPGEGLAGEIGPAALFIEHDVRDEAGWPGVFQQTAEAFGPVNVLVQSAGISRPGSVEDATVEDWREHMAVNGEGAFLGCRAAVAAMKYTGGGSIVNISTIESVRPGPLFLAYGASKAAMDAITKTVALHCGEMTYNIRCNSVHPAAIYTPILEWYLNQSPDPKRLHDIYAGMQPLNRIGTIDEVAHTVLFLASDESSFITGHQMYVDGGALTKPYPAGQGA